MSLDPQIEILLKQLAAEDGPAPESRTVAENRAAGRAFAALAAAPEPVADVRNTTTTTTAAAADGHDIPVRIYRPVTELDAGPLPVTLFFHGGGWVFGDLDTQDHIARTVAARSGTIVVSVDYRLAPEHRFPAATDDAYAALTWVADNAAGFGGDGERIAVFGESAGGNLAAALAQESLRRGGPRITLQVLAYPAVDRFDDSSSMYENTTGPILSRSYLEWFWGAYLSTPDQGADPRVSAGALRPAGLCRRAPTNWPGSLPPSSPPPRTTPCATRGTAMPASWPTPACRSSTSRSREPSTGSSRSPARCNSRGTY